MTPYQALPGSCTGHSGEKENMNVTAKNQTLAFQTRDKSFYWARYKDGSLITRYQSPCRIKAAAVTVQYRILITLHNDELVELAWKPLTDCDVMLL
jgi:hypothetical protein